MPNRDLKFRKKGFVMEVNLHYRNYGVEAVILKAGGGDANTYDVTLRLFRYDVGKFDALDEEHYMIASERINLSTYDFIMDKFANGFFKKFIDRYEYELLCFEKGNALYEEEQQGRSKY